ncbi:hypothetical protein [Paraburkholderia sp. SIMBA_054]|uniref:hypothetical protein n=1 Tax=Paraburkholderia sp. SIMBA_054 TaxID=3085795 RepID=UPI003977E8BE
MGFALLPLAVVLFFAGLTMEAMQFASAAPGSGQLARQDSLAAVAALQAEAFSTACLNAALATPGSVSSNIAVALPVGVTAPANAECMTTAGPAGSRYVYSYVPSVPGEAGQIASDTAMSELWLRGLGQGNAASLATGQMTTVPATIPAGTVVQQVLVTP